MLVAIPLHAFGMAGASGSPTDITTLLAEHSDIWINASASPLFLAGSTPDDARFIWQSERSGFMHLELAHAVAGAGTYQRQRGEREKTKRRESNQNVTPAPRCSSFPVVVWFTALIRRPRFLS